MEINKKTMIEVYNSIKNFSADTLLKKLSEHEKNIVHIVLKALSNDQEKVDIELTEEDIKKFKNMHRCDYFYPRTKLQLIKNALRIFFGRESLTLEKELETTRNAIKYDYAPYASFVLDTYASVDELYENLKSPTALENIQSYLTNIEASIALIKKRKKEPFQKNKLDFLQFIQKQLKEDLKQIKSSNVCDSEKLEASKKLFSDKKAEFIRSLQSNWQFYKDSANAIENMVGERIIPKHIQK